MTPRTKWYLICFPIFLVGIGIIIAIAKFRAELSINEATVLFYLGAGIVAISLTIHNIKGNELA